MNSHAALPHISLPQVPGLVFRPLAPADIQPWFELVRRIAKRDGAPWHEQLSDLREVLESEVNPAAVHTVVGADSQGTPRAYGYISKNPASGVGYAFGGVDPQWRRRGTGSAILAWQRAVLAFRSVSDGEPATVFRSYVQEVTPGHAQLLQRSGFTPVRTFTELARPLLDLPEPVALQGVDIVPFSPELGEGVRLAHNDAFADHWGSEPRSAKKWATLMAHEDFRPEWSSVAIDQASGEVAGYQISMFDATVLAASGFKEGYTELLGVRRAWRGRGIAPALLVDAMGRYVAAGMDRACLDVDTENPSGAVGLYVRLGYQAIPGRQSVAWDLQLWRG